ncbi:MAG: hypothetical protein KAH93_05360, partial [Candidatus Aenigmarchaeota archaeon]|nr:hypothetical protein [Candidatus Aenigmarchaeota archaeon]
MDADKNKLRWCMKQKKGIALTETKPHLSDSYMREADDTLENVLVTKGKWKVITAYYACYNALYSILMKCGIRSEIHDCSIELMALFDFEESDIKYIRTLKQDRIQVQYYLEKIYLEDENNVRKFIFKCKQILNDLNSSKIENARKLLES